jgi:hypothetical protein
LGVVRSDVAIENLAVERPQTWSRTARRRTPRRSRDGRNRPDPPRERGLTLLQ